MCLSNNTSGKDSYLIFGVSNNFEICGVNKQKNSEEIYDLLKNIKFAGDHTPKVELKHIYYQSKKIDVLVCKKSKYIPIYLTEKYRDVNPFHIYTRVGDTNTPKGKMQVMRMLKNYGKCILTFQKNKLKEKFLIKEYFLTRINNYD